jgi:hypothetical protein
MMRHTEDGWIKASASNGGGDCVEMRRSEENIQVRDSKLGADSPIHVLTRNSFVAWLAGAKNHEYDALA